MPGSVKQVVGHPYRVRHVGRIIGELVPYRAEATGLLAPDWHLQDYLTPYIRDHPKLLLFLEPASLRAWAGRFRMIFAQFDFEKLPATFMRSKLDRTIGVWRPLS